MSSIQAKLAVSTGLSDAYKIDPNSKYGWKDNSLDFSPLEETLLKYNSPLVQEKTKPRAFTDSKDTLDPEDGFSLSGSEPEQERFHFETVSLLFKLEDTKPQSMCHHRNLRPEEIENLLAVIHDPQTWEEDETTYVRRISGEKSSPEEATELQARLDKLLLERFARPNELCPIRRALYDECFDEVIRQVTLETPERGIALLRCRAEFRLTTLIYCRLFEGIICFNMRKNLKHNSVELTTSVEELRKEVESIQKELNKLEDLLEAAGVQHTEELDKLRKKNNDELDYLKTSNLRLKSLLDDYTTFKKPGRTKTEENMQKAAKSSADVPKAPEEAATETSKKSLG